MSNLADKLIGGLIALGVMIVGTIIIGSWRKFSRRVSDRIQLKSKLIFTSSVNLPGLPRPLRCSGMLLTITNVGNRIAKIENVWLKARGRGKATTPKNGGRRG